MFKTAQAELAQANSGVLDAASTLIDTIRADIQDAIGQSLMEAGAVIGQADNELSAVKTTVERATDKVMTTILSELIYSQEELYVNGVAVPRSIDAIRYDLADQTGERLISRLTGTDPDQTNAPNTGETPDYEIPTNAPQAETLGESSFPTPVSPIGPVGVTPISITAPSPPGTTPAQPAGACGCPAPVINVTCPAPVGESPPLSPPMPPPPPPEEPVVTGGVSPPSPPSPPAPPPPPPPPNAGNVAPPVTSSPKNPFVGGTEALELPTVEWYAPDVCQRIVGALAYIRHSKAPKQTGATANISGGFLSDAYRVGRATTDSLIEAVMSGFDKDKTQQTFLASYRQTGDILGGTSQARTVFDFLPSELVPDPDIIWTLLFTLGTAHKAEADSGIPLTKFTKQYDYLLNTYCAIDLPSPAELDTMRRVGLITEDRWKCLLQALGIDWALRSLYYDGTAPVPSPDQVARLYNRGTITNARAAEMLALSGYTNVEQRDWVYSLSVEIPAVSDLVRFMVRDSADDTVAKQYGYDTDFETKLYGAGGKGAPGPMASWMRANGLTEDVMRYYWRSHWEIPSNTALYEMLHRLRPDRPEIARWDSAAEKNGEDAAKAVLGARPDVVTPKDVQTAIEVNDMSPFWVPKLIQISYHPITRTDAIDAFHAGAFNESDLYHAMRDNGYSDPDAQRLVDIQKAKRGTRLANKSGVWTERKILQAYMAGEINGVRADMLLQPLVVDARIRQSLIDGADQMVNAKERGATLKRLRREYIVGQTDDKAMLVKLDAMGMSPARANNLLSIWQDEQRGRLREPTAKMVLGWLQARIITADDCFQRLLRLGYMTPDAERMVYQGVTTANAQLNREYEAEKKQLSKIINDQKRAKNAADKELAQREAELRRQIAAMEKERDRIQKEQELRSGLRPK